MSYDLYVLDGPAPEDDDTFFALIDEYDELRALSVSPEPTPTIVAFTSAAEARWPDEPADGEEWPWASWPLGGVGRWVEINLTGGAGDQVPILLQMALDAGLVVLDPQEGEVVTEA